MSELRILSLNLHCLVEADLDAKQRRIAREIHDRDIDVVCLQEVAQSMDQPLVHDNIKADNYALTLQRLLHDLGKHYHLAFVPFKMSFNKYDEGLAILSRHTLHNVAHAYLSKGRDYADWTTRKILVADIHLEENVLSVATTHFGWTDDNETFEDQVDTAMRLLQRDNPVLLAGDFNVRPNTTEFQHVLSHGFHDVFADDPMLSTHPTHGGMYVHETASRIDYIVVNRPHERLDGAILFTEEPVSDHYGIYARIKLK